MPLRKSPVPTATTSKKRLRFRLILPRVDHGRSATTPAFRQDEDDDQSS
jgi:hypothetical protein